MASNTHTATVFYYFTVPEWKDNEASDDEGCSKHDEDVVAGISPSSIVEHLCRLSEEERSIHSNVNQQCKPPQDISSVAVHKVAVWCLEGWDLLGVVRINYISKKRGRPSR